tara:strand:+ start:2612 stop:3211 length:600 start_codon:yes stop_codon:yes gene_type:complete
MPKTSETTYEKTREVISKLANIQLGAEQKLWLTGLLKQQEKWKTKADLITEYRVKKTNGALFLQVKLPTCNKWLMVSWRSSCSNISIVVNPLISAMRNSIHPQIRKWKKINCKTRSCQNCSCNAKLQADHAACSFKELSETFISNQPIIPTEFDYTKYGRKFKKADVHFKKCWVVYHKDNATLQWLCKTCNLKKSCNAV